MKFARVGVAVAAAAIVEPAPRAATITMACHRKAAFLRVINVSLSFASGSPVGVMRRPMSGCVRHDRATRGTEWRGESDAGADALG